MYGFQGVTTVPHAKKNMASKGDLLRVPFSFSLDLQKAWDQVKKKKYENIIENNSTEIFDIRQKLVNACKAPFMELRKNPPMLAPLIVLILASLKYLIITLDIQQVLTIK